MAQLPHFDIEGAVYFVTTRLREDQSLITKFEAEIIQKVILDLSNEEEIRLHAYAIMPNHLHILLEPKSHGISKTMQLIKGRSSRQINVWRKANASPTLHHLRMGRALGRSDFSHPPNLWQKGFFDFTILTEKKFKEKINYIHYNPVKWGLVEKAENYKYSSAREYKRKYGEVFY
jgi:REP element-mobilizing transposase RayT